MERPTCLTCPYWNEHAWKGYTHDPFGEPILFEDGTVNEDSKFGHCMRNSPRPVVGPLRTDSLPILPEWPSMCEGDWCGEHPDFPEWLAARKAQ